MKDVIEMSEIKDRILIFEHFLLQIRDETDFKNFLDVFIHRLINHKVGKNQKLVLNILVNKILTMIFIMLKITPSRNVVEFLELANDLNLVSPVFRTKVNEMIVKYEELKFGVDSLKPNPKSLKIAKKISPDFYNINISQILGNNDVLNFEKNYGYSILDRTGNFIWCDKMTEKYFEFTSTKSMFSNFFDMMIPYSRKIVREKFCDKNEADNYIFDRDFRPGSKIAFSYCIYSKKKRN